MSPMIGQEDLRRQLVADTERDTKRARALALDLDGPHLHQRPPSGGWSIAEVYEHLCVANDSYLALIEKLIADGKSERATRTATWKPTLAGGLLVRSLESPRKLRAPKAFKPGPQPRPNVVDQFIDRQRWLLGQLDATSDIDWRRARIASPIVSL